MRRNDLIGGDFIVLDCLRRGDERRVKDFLFCRLACHVLGWDARFAEGFLKALTELGVRCLGDLSSNAFVILFSAK